MDHRHIFFKLPSRVPEQADGPPCQNCAALCCRYFALELDVPEDREDFEQLRWFLVHGNTWLWVNDGEWFLQVDEPCRYLGPGNECKIYDRRPQICRDYGMPENMEHPDEPLCDFFAQHERHDMEFRTLEELDAYRDKFFADKEARRDQRSRAAKKGWSKRRKSHHCLAAPDH